MIDYSITPHEIVTLHLEVDGWMGDDLCAVAGNNYFVTERLRALIESSRLSGFRFGPMIVSRSELFDDLQGELELPPFWWLKVHRGEGEADFTVGPGEDGVPTLIVSKKALDCLRSLSLAHCLVVPLDA